MDSIDDIAKQVKRLTYDLETVRRSAENTTDIDRFRDDLDALILKVRRLELAHKNEQKQARFTGANLDDNGIPKSFCNNISFYNI